MDSKILKVWWPETCYIKLTCLLCQQIQTIPHIEWFSWSVACPVAPADVTGARPPRLRELLEEFRCNVLYICIAE